MNISHLVDGKDGKDLGDEAGEDDEVGGLEP